MTWSLNSADLNLIENLCSILKSEVYRDGRQFRCKDNLWVALQEAAAAIPASTVSTEEGVACKQMKKYILLF